MDAAFEKQLATTIAFSAIPSNRGREGPCQDMLGGPLRERGYEVDDWIIDQDAAEIAPGLRTGAGSTGPVRLTEAEERYRAIVEHVPAAIYLDRADQSMHSLYVSPQIEEIMGVSAQEWIDAPDLWLTMMAPEDRAETERTYLEALTARSSLEGRVPRQHARRPHDLGARRDHVRRRRRGRAVVLEGARWTSPSASSPSRRSVSPSDGNATRPSDSGARRDEEHVPRGRLA